MIQAPRGTVDVLGEDVTRRHAVAAQAKRVLEAAGFERIETPAFEYTELFARGVGEAITGLGRTRYAAIPILAALSRDWHSVSFIVKPIKGLSTKQR